MPIFTLFTIQISSNKHVPNKEPALGSMLQIRLLEDEGHHAQRRGMWVPDNLEMC